MNKQTNPGGLNDLLNDFKNEIMHDLNCVQIGIVQEFYPENQTADVQIALKHVINVSPDGTQTLKERPLLIRCPVMVLTGGAARITMPITKGDTCIILFNDREIDNWFDIGGVQVPTTIRAHDLSDGICIVGIRNTQNAIASYFMGGIEVAHGGGSIQVTDTGVMAGPTLTSPIIAAGNGATGSFNFVTVENGIVTGGS